MIPLINNLLELGLLEHKGEALDVGCGKGGAATSLRDLGYTVTAIDTDPPEILLGVDVLATDLRDFNFIDNKYMVVICSNVLPFITDKTEVEKLLEKMVRSLHDKGVLYFSVFGMKDAWNAKPNMSFFTDYEIDSIVTGLGIKVLQKNVLEGISKTLSGSVKYSHIFRYILQK